jgi:hypothetical protein
MRAEMGRSTAIRLTPEVGPRDIVILGSIRCDLDKPNLISLLIYNISQVRLPVLRSLSQ